MRWARPPPGRTNFASSNRSPFGKLRITENAPRGALIRHHGAPPTSRYPARAAPSATPGSRQYALAGRFLDTRLSRPLGDATTPPAGRAPSPNPGRPVASAPGSLAEQAHTPPAVSGAAIGYFGTSGAPPAARRQGRTRPFQPIGWLLPWTILDQWKGAGAHLHGLLSLRWPTPSRGSWSRREPPGASSGAAHPSTLTPANCRDRAARACYI